MLSISDIWAITRILGNKFKKLSTEAINSYLDSGEYKDKAGAYAIQGKSGMFVEKVHGNFASIMGLPTNLLYDVLKQENILYTL